MLPASLSDDDADDALPAISPMAAARIRKIEHPDLARKAP
jgi:hypothetical protein